MICFSKFIKFKTGGTAACKAQKINTNIPSAMTSQEFNLKSVMIRQFQTKSWDLTMIMRKY